MRQEILTYLTTNLTGDIKVSEELPWESGDQPLYLKNMKRVYVDRAENTQETLINTLPPGCKIVRNITTITAYLAVDAKKQPTILDSVINTITAAKDVSVSQAVIARECDYETEIEGDVLTYTFSIRFINIT